MFFNEILYGTQYYRSPTPLKDEWAGDLKNMADYSLGIIQIRINWRNNERAEGVYDFSDVDELLALAEKNGLKVVMKFLLECAPQYVFDKLGGARTGAKGEVLRGGYHGAFFGGFKPCFNNPEVKAAAERFVGKVTERYYKNKNIILWNVWNEPRNRPIEECFCPHCRKAFGEYLREKFGTIEKLNEFYGATEDSFESINLPAMAHGYWDIFEFKKFLAGETQYNNLRFVRDAIKKFDKNRPIMSHVGFTAAFQYKLGDMCDDFRASEAVDFWGTSIPFDTDMITNDKRLDMQLLLDFLRSVDENFFLHEIYPGLGMFRWYDTRFDMNFKLYSALSCGAKGMFFWQYRAERVGNENDCAGIMRADGTPRDVAYEVRDFGNVLKADMPLFAAAHAEKADIAVVFDFDCSLMSVIEDASLGDLYTFESDNPVKYYIESHSGAYKLLRNLNYKVDYVAVRNVEKFGEYKVLFVPYQCFIKPDFKHELEKFVLNGGVAVLDEGFGLRDLNTWLNPYDINFGLFKARIKERRFISADESVMFNGKKTQICAYRSIIDAFGGKPIAFFDGADDCVFANKPAAFEFSCGKGKVYLFGVSIGCSYYNGEKKFAEIIGDLLPENVAKYSYADPENGIYEKALVCADGKKITFILNAEKQDFKIKTPQNFVKTGAAAKSAGGFIVIPAHSSGYFVTDGKQ